MTERGQRSSAAMFEQRYPEYTKTRALDTLRATDFSRLDRRGDVYLDYTGSGLYGESQIQAHMDLLSTRVLGNPHSVNPTSQETTGLVEGARSAVRDFFHASPDEYTVIFTPNASGALKLVGEAYPFRVGSHFLLPLDNHNSVNGIREFARTKGATTTYLPLTPELRLDEEELSRHLERHSQDTTGNLFAYPAQSNFSGVQHPLEWIGAAQSKGWDVLLDAAAFVPTNELDLSKWHPDFVSVSFYKMFGYPTGVGALIARNETVDKLKRPWFAGGTIHAVSAQGDWHQMLPGGEAFEDGTLNFLSLPAVQIGLEYVDRIGIPTIHERVTALTGHLLEQTQQMTHANGQPLIEVYGPRTTDRRGATIAFNILDQQGAIIDERIVDNRSRDRRMSLRSGCFCNPGAGEAAFHISHEKVTMQEVQQAPMSMDEYLSTLNLQSAGSIRASLGTVSNLADAEALLDFIGSFRDNNPYGEPLNPRKNC